MTELEIQLWTGANWESQRPQLGPTVNAPPFRYEDRESAELALARLFPREPAENLRVEPAKGVTR